MDINKSIKCSVQECAYHAGEKNYCSLDSIMVGAHEPDPKENRCVDCESFEVK